MGKNKLLNRSWIQTHGGTITGSKNHCRILRKNVLLLSADHLLVMFKQVLTAKPLVLTKSCNIHDSTVDEPLLDTPNSYSDIEPLVSHA